MKIVHRLYNIYSYIDESATERRGGERVGGHICERAREEDRYEDALLLSRSLGSSRL